MNESLDYSVSKLINSILKIIESSLKQKKPNVKDAIAKINRIRDICNTSIRDFDKPISRIDNSFRHELHYTYNCLYQCGFKTTSIREIDSHLTNVHDHPETKRDYNHPIYNES